jgi:ParB-like chromosome segregation protein Spo0J
MQIHSVPITDLRIDPANARRHSDRNIDAIMSSLMRFGQQKPIVIDANNVVRAGNGTLAAAKGLGWTHIDVVRSDLIGVEATAFAIADNRTAELAEWDTEVLAAALNDPDIGDLGFDAKEIRKILGELQEAGPQLPTQLGDTFQVIVECHDEAQQKELFDRVTAEGFTCRLLTL